MAWFGKRLRARKRLDLERKALAASVEELTAQNEPGDDVWNEDEPDSVVSRTAIVPPRLRLQSRPLPIVRPGVMKQARAEREQTLSESSSYAISSVAVQKKRLGRSTKVHLQAVRPGEAQEATTDYMAAVADKQENLGKSESAMSGMQHLLDSQIDRREADRAVSLDSHLLSGSALIKQGQTEVMIPSPGISKQSVVTVMLTGDPGPVVVHYVSLHPSTGFTVHLSAPVTAPTPFNYIVWLP